MSSTSVDFSVWGLFVQADWFVKAIMLLLLVASILSWAIIIEKYIKLLDLQKKSKEFMKVFWSDKTVSDLYSLYKDRDDGIYSKVFIGAIHEWELQTNHMINHSGARSRLKDRVYDAMSSIKNKYLQDLEKNMDWLGTISSSAPFIGLLGTVWGIMNSFRSIAENQSANIAVVAPGISEALLATGIGLLAAIPANIFYNILNNKISVYQESIDDFGLELLNLLTRELDK